MTDFKRILVVDDNFEILNSIRSILESAASEYQVIGVPSAEEAILELLRAPVDLLITDIYLPGVSGRALIDRVNELWSGLPIIVITGHAERMSPEDASAAGIVHYFKKPLNVEIFLNAVNTTLSTSTITEGERQAETKEEISPALAQLIQISIEDLRTVSGAREVLLARQEGEKAFVTGGRDSALSSFTANLAGTMRGVLQLATEVGSADPTTFHCLTDPLFELYFANVGSEYFIAILYYAQPQKRDVSLVWSSMEKTIEDLRPSLEGGEVSESPIAPAIQSESEVDIETIPESGEAESGDVELVEDELAQQEITPEVSESQHVTTPKKGNGTDLDAYWEEAAASVAGDEGNASGLTFEEAQKLGLLPSDFDPEDRLPE